MIRADAPPMAPASSVSANCTKPGVGRHAGRRIVAAAPRVVAERGIGALGAEESREQRPQFRQRRLAPPDVHVGPFAGAAEHVDEARRLRLLRHALPREHRHDDVGADVGDHAPEHRVRDVVEPREPEQRVRLEQRDAERPLVQEADRQPARLGERRQQQRVEPDGESGAEPRERARARGALPVDAADGRRRELRDRREGDEADRHQRVGFAGETEVEVAEQHDRDDRAAADAEQQAREVLLLGEPHRPHAQQHGHHEVVAHHRRQRDGLDDHHARWRRTARR